MNTVYRIQINYLLLPGALPRQTATTSNFPTSTSKSLTVRCHDCAAPHHQVQALAYRRASAVSTGPTPASSAFRSTPTTSTMPPASRPLSTSAQYAVRMPHDHSSHDLVGDTQYKVRASVHIGPGLLSILAYLVGQLASSEKREYSIFYKYKQVFKLSLRDRLKGTNNTPVVGILATGGRRVRI